MIRVVKCFYSSFRQNRYRLLTGYFSSLALPSIAYLLVVLSFYCCACYCRAARWAVSDSRATTTERWRNRETDKNMKCKQHSRWLVGVATFWLLSCHMPQQLEAKRRAVNSISNWIASQSKRNECHKKLHVHHGRGQLDFFWTLARAVSAFRSRTRRRGGRTTNGIR